MYSSTFMCSSECYCASEDIQPWLEPENQGRLDEFDRTNIGRLLQAASMTVEFKDSNGKVPIRHMPKSNAGTTTLHNEFLTCNEALL